MPKTLSERPAARPMRLLILVHFFKCFHPCKHWLPHPYPQQQLCSGQNWRSEDGEPSSFPSDGFIDLHLDLRCFSFHHELLQLGEQALEDHCADAHLFGDDTLGQRPTMGVTLVCGDRFFLTQGHLRERGAPVLLVSCVYACTAWRFQCAQCGSTTVVKIVCLWLCPCQCPHVCACSFRSSVCAV